MRVAPAARPSCCPDTLPKAMLECHTAFCAGPDTPAALPCRLLFQGMIVISRAAGGRGPLPPLLRFHLAFVAAASCRLPSAIFRPATAAVCVRVCAWQIGYPVRTCKPPFWDCAPTVLYRVLSAAPSSRPP